MAVPVAPSITGDKVSVADVEAALAATIAGSKEAASVRRFSEDNPGAIPYGVEARFYSGAKVRVNFVTAHGSGLRPGPDYDLPESI